VLLSEVMTKVENNFRFGSEGAVIVLLLLSYTLPSFAQPSVGVRPLTIEHPQPSFGFELGVGQNSLSGTSSFSGGKGTGWSGSTFFELPIGNDFNVGLNAGYDRENTSTTTPENENIVVVIPNNNQAETANVSDNRIAVFNISFFHFDPFIQYQVLHSDFFIQVGAGISVLSSNQLTQTRELTNRTITLANGTTTNNVTFANGTTSETIQDGSIAGITNPQFSGLLSAGYNFRFGMVSIAPMINYDYPFTTNTSPNGNNWKISTISSSIAMKFNL
jgi:hypothetical protein